MCKVSAIEVEDKMVSPRDWEDGEDEGRVGLWVPSSCWLRKINSGLLYSSMVTDNNK